jgi:uncharacterized protein
MHESVEYAVEYERRYDDKHSYDKFREERPANKEEAEAFASHVEIQDGVKEGSVKILRRTVSDWEVVERETA